MSDYGYGGPAPTGAGGYGGQGGQGGGGGYGGAGGGGYGGPPPGGGYGGPPGGGYGGPPQRGVTIGDLLGESMRAVVNNFATFVVAALVFAIPSNLLSMIGSKRFTDSMLGIIPMTQEGVTDPDELFGSIDFTGLMIFCIAAPLVSLICNNLCQGTLTYASVESVAGNRVSPGDALAKGFRSAPSILVIAIVLTIFYFLACLPGTVGWVLLTAGLGAAGGSDPVGPLFAVCCGCPAMVIMIIAPIVWIMILFFLAIPAAVAEQCGPIEAMQRSLRLTKGHRLKILAGLLVILVVFVVVVILGMIVTAPFGGGQIDPSTGQMQGMSTGALIIGTIVGIGQTMVLLTMLSSFAGVTYAKIRGVDEGVDAASIASVFS
ncbi:MAG: glycerophosphoryl diester phosphodiesterase membrane domain-containing protein [Deltaproteobacteria bacterium]|nr:glycerophosphoryl diester phosphodiesterase membrane domain-containing protein [Deltaproteobacteria bacterium]